MMAASTGVRKDLKYDDILQYLNNKEIQLLLLRVIVFHCFDER